MDQRGCLIIVLFMTKSGTNEDGENTGNSAAQSGGRSFKGDRKTTGKLRKACGSMQNVVDAAWLGTSWPICVSAQLSTYLSVYPSAYLLILVFSCPTV